MLRDVYRNPWVQAGALVAALVGLGVLAYLLSPVLVPLFFAFIVAYVFDPVVDIFEARKIPRGVTISGLAVVAIIALLCIPVFLVPSMVREADALIHGTEEGVTEGPLAKVGEKVTQWLPLREWVIQLGWVEKEEEFNARDVIAEKIGLYVKQNAVSLMKTYGAQAASYSQRAGSTVAQLFRSVGQGTMNVVLFLGNVALFAFVAGYLLKDYDRIVVAAKDLVPVKWRDKTYDIGARIDEQVRSFLRGQVVVCAFLAFMYCTGLFIAGTPFAVVLGLFGGAVSFIPYLGIALTILPAIALTLLQHGLDWHVFMAAGTFIVAQMIEGTILTPKIVGDKVGLNPVWVILAILVFGNALGFLGLLLAVPIAASLKVLVLEGVEYYRTSPVFGSDSTTRHDGGTGDGSG